MRRFIILFSIIIVLIGGIIAFTQYNKKHADLNTENAAFRLEATTLFNAFSADEEVANSQYLNQIIEVTGQIFKIESRAEQGTQVFLSTRDDMFGVICDLAPGQETGGLKPGDSVIVRGICSGFLMDVALNRCVIIKQ